ncbi:MAG: hypothetical protein IKH54_05180 [Bacilli bacterium]|nr:hypothetical protein [Bacilli bacterium]
MKEQDKLTLQMILLFFVIFVFFGVIIVNEKISPLKIPKVTEKLETYLNENYKDIINDINIGTTEYKNMKYELKISNKKNSNLYFYLYYEDKKITDTYKKDYVEGKTIINYQEKQIKKNIKNKTGSNFEIKILKTLDKYTDNIKEKIINSEDPETIKIYNLKANITLDEFKESNIEKTLKHFDNNLKDKNITPKNYTFNIQDPEDETKVLSLTIDSKTIESNDFNAIINAIINKKKSNLIDIYEVTYEYLN